MTLKLCSSVEYQRKNILIENSCRKCAAKASPRHLYNFGKQSKTAIVYMQKIILKARCFERGLSKSLKKSNFLCFFEPSPFQ